MKWSKDDILSVLESLLLAADKPLKISDFLSCMGENFKSSDIQKAWKICQRISEKK